MEQILKELGLYDLLAYFVIGAVALGSIIASIEAFRQTRAQQSEINFWKNETKLAVTLFIVASYIVGNMIQATASFLDNSIASTNSIEQHYPGNENAEFRDNFHLKVTQAFGLHDPQPKQIFDLCQTYTQIRNIDPYIQIMQGRYAFFRGLTIALFICCISFGLKGDWDDKRTSSTSSISYSKKRSLLKSFVLAWLPPLFLLGTLLSIQRAIDYNNYFVQHVYRAFYVSYPLSETEDKQK